MDGPDLELYRELKREGGGFYDKVQALWLQKFTLVGGVVAATLLNSEHLSALRTAAQLPWVLEAVIILVPLVAIVLDMKIAESLLNARVVSRFIVQEFPESPRLARWEELMWLERDTHDALTVWARMVITIAAAALPTLALIFAAAATLQAVSQRANWLMAGGALAALYVGAVVLIGWVLLRHSPELTSDAAPPPAARR